MTRSHLKCSRLIAAIWRTAGTCCVRPGMNFPEKTAGRGGVPGRPKVQCSVLSADGICSFNHGLVIRQHSFEDAKRIATLESGFRGLEEAHQVRPAVVINVFAIGVAESQALLIARSAEGQRSHI